jgi:hypothetical protein
MRQDVGVDRDAVACQPLRLDVLAQDSQGEYPRSPIPRDTNGEGTPLTGHRADQCDGFGIRTGGHSSKLVDPVWVTELPFGPVVVPL